MPKRKWLKIGTRVEFTQRAASCVRVVEDDPQFDDPSNHLNLTGMRRIEKDYGCIHRRDWPMITDNGRQILRELSLKPDGYSWSLTFRLPMVEEKYGPRKGQLRPLTRWVMTWEEPGEGWVVGLVYRQEGWREGDGGYTWSGEPPEGESFYLHAINRVPLYQIKTSLTSRIILVPALNVHPIDTKEN